MTSSTIAPSNSPTIDSIMLLSPTEIQVNWTAVPEIDRNGVISMYEVLYMSAFSINGSVFTMDGDTFTAHITGLEEFVVYNVSVRAYTSAGPGPFSEVETAGGAGECLVKLMYALGTITFQGFRYSFRSETRMVPKQPRKASRESLSLPICLFVLCV